RRSAARPHSWGPGRGTARGSPPGRRAGRRAPGRSCADNPADRGDHFRARDGLLARTFGAPGGVVGDLAGERAAEVEILDGHAAGGALVVADDHGGRAEAAVG